MDHVITDNRHGLVLAVSQAAGDAETAAALAMLDELEARHALSGVERGGCCTGRLWRRGCGSTSCGR